MIRLENVGKVYHDGGLHVHALRGIEFEVRRGE